MKLKWVRSAIFACALCCGAAPPVTAAEVEGVKLPETVRLGQAGPQLVLNGAGVRTRFFFRVYVGALYLEQKQTDADKVINHRGLKHVAIHMLRGLGSDQLFYAIRDGMSKNHAEVQMTALEPRLRQLEAMFDTGKALEKGDTVRLEILPGVGTRVFVNSESRGTLAGDEIGRAMLRVWFGEHPADEDLKKAMLGGGA